MLPMGFKSIMQTSGSRCIMLTFQLPGQISGLSRPPVSVSEGSEGFQPLGDNTGKSKQKYSRYKISQKEYFINDFNKTKLFSQRSWQYQHTCRAHKALVLLHLIRGVLNLKFISPPPITNFKKYEFSPLYSYSFNQFFSPNIYLARFLPGGGGATEKYTPLHLIIIWKT